MRVILIPGWNEQAKLMRTFSDGRNGKDGLAAFGFDCTVFPDGNETLRERIDRFGSFLDRLHAREPDAFPVATVGYSAGGLINRGFLRAYPQRAHEIAATVQVAAPNTGLVTNYAVGTLRLARMPTHMLADMDVASPFMTWLNGCTGHWVTDPDNPKKQRWQLVGELPTRRGGFGRYEYCGANQRSAYKDSAGSAGKRPEFHGDDCARAGFRGLRW